MSDQDAVGPPWNPESDDFPLFVLAVITALAILCILLSILAQYCSEIVHTGGIGVSLGTRVFNTQSSEEEAEVREEEIAYSRVAKDEEVKDNDTPCAFREI